jgi:hypothetical protein
VKRSCARLTLAAAFVRASPAVGLARPFMWVRTIPARLTGGETVDDAVWSRPLLAGTAVLAQAAKP